MAMGAKLAAPEKDVICLEGDGGLMCGILSELETAAHYGIGVTTIVFNNGTLGHERFNMAAGQDYMDFQSGIDFAICDVLAQHRVVRQVGAVCLGAGPEERQVAGGASGFCRLPVRPPGSVRCRGRSACSRWWACCSWGSLAPLLRWPCSA